MTDRPRFDLAAIDMLRRVGGDALPLKMAEMFRDTAPAKIASARAALTKLDAAALALSAHSLKSSSGQLGASRLQEICADMESRVPTAATRVSIVHLLDAAESEMKHAVGWLESTLGERGAAALTRIAVVEDNPDNMLLVRLILEELYEVVGYSDGAMALEGMQRFVPALVLLDISLPGMDGIEVLSRMKSSDELRDVPVIALTAHAAQMDRDRFITAGFNDYVTKPIVDETLLLSAISRLVGDSANE